MKFSPKLSPIRFSFQNIALVLSLLLFATCIKKDTGCTDETAINYNPDALSDDGSCQYNEAIPDVYGFTRFGISSVNYEAPIVRQLLIQDLKMAIENLATLDARPAEQQLLNYYATALNDQDILTNFPNGEMASDTTYGNIAENIQLANVIASTHDTDEFIRLLLGIITVFSNDPDLLNTTAVYTANNGIDLRQMIHITLLGSVIFANATEDLNMISTFANNALLTEDCTTLGGKCYTAQEHAWDEAFGYFGAAAQYAQFSDAELAGTETHYRDIDGDGLIDFEREYNFSFAVLAGERDVSHPETDFTNQIFTLFKKGRTFTSQKMASDSIVLVAQNVIEIWEEIIAATAVHHYNALLLEMDNLGTPQENILALNKHWTSLKAWVMALRYNPLNRLTEVENLLTWIGEAPVYDTDQLAVYRALLANVATEIQLVYGFSEAQMEAW